MTSAIIEPSTLASASHKAAYDVGGVPLETTGASAILLVSVGADYHEGEKLGAAVDLINRSEFARLSIAVADTLQRHNYSGGTLTERHRRAHQDGTKWIERNRPYFDHIQCPHTIERWDYSLSHPRYGDLYDRVEGAYHGDQQYRDAVDSTVDRYLSRRGALATPAEDVGEEEVRRRCRTYILEECPIIMPLWAEASFDFVIYPQRISAAMGRTRELFVEPDHPTRVRWLPLRFKKRKSAR